MTLKNIIKEFLRGKKDSMATLKEIYAAIDESGYESNSDTVHDSARTVIYRNKDDFKRVCKGMYMLVGEESASLLIEGDGRKISELEDSCIDLIVTDHPWEDKKAHKSGNQKHFADYNTFKYTLEDFKHKARVLKEGGYLVEFLPIESSTNYEYLYEIKQMAKKNGLNFYTSCIWRNAKEGTINTGKCTKGVQSIVVFSKGKPRKLSREGVAGYQTTEILNYEIEILLNTKNKHHQAEKPIELYSYILERFTKKGDCVLDQFGGSCNLIQAAVNLKRFAIVYEVAKDFIAKAVDRFKMTTLCREVIDTPSFTEGVVGLSPAMF